VCLRPAKTASQVGVRAVQKARVEAIIQRELGSARLTVAWLCRVANVSRSTIHRMFEAEGGAATHIRRRRLQRAYEKLADPDAPETSISRIAEACGFHNAASFNRAFRTAFGCTPREVRARVWPEEPGGVREPAAPGADGPLATQEPTTAARVGP